MYVEYVCSVKCRVMLCLGACNINLVVSVMHVLRIFCVAY